MRPSAFRRLRQFTTLTVLVTFVSQTVFGYMPAQTVWDQRRDAGRHKTYEVAGLPLSSMPLMRSSLPFSAVRPSLLPSSNPSLVRLKRLLTALAPNGVVRDVSEGSSKT